VADQFSDEELTQYVLGKLAEPERARLEEAYFDDDALYERLSAIEEELAEAFAGGGLEPDERRRFEERLRKSPRLRGRGDFMRTLASTLEGQPAPLARERATAPGWRGRLLEALGGPRVGFAIAAAVLLVAFGALWIAREGPRPGPAPDEIATVPPEPRPSPPDAPGSQPPPGEAPVPPESETTPPAPQPPETKPPRSEPLLAEPVAVVAFALSPGVSRGGDAAAQLRVPPGTRSVRLTLPLEEPVEGALTAVLRENAGRVVWRSGLLRARGVLSDAVITATVPAKLLPAGTYLLTLERASGTDASETVEQYAFEVTSAAP
jgi:hypothetical protein